MTPVIQSLLDVPEDITKQIKARIERTRKNLDALAEEYNLERSLLDTLYNEVFIWPHTTKRFNR